jgi:hypothetical protein
MPTKQGAHFPCLFSHGQLFMDLPIHKFRPITNDPFTYCYYGMQLVSY